MQQDMQQERVSAGGIFLAIAGYWMRRYRLPLATAAVVVLMVATGIILWPEGDQKEVRDDLLKQYTQQHKKQAPGTGKRVPISSAPGATASGSLSHRIQNDLPDKILSEMAEFKVIQSNTVPEGMDPMMAEAANLSSLNKAHRAMEEKKYEEAYILYTQALKEKSRNQYVGLYAWGGIMEICQLNGDQEGFEEALAKYTECLQLLGFAAAGENGFDLLAMLNNMDEFQKNLDGYIKKVDELSEDVKIDRTMFKERLKDLGSEFEGMLKPTGQGEVNNTEQEGGGR